MLEHVRPVHILRPEVDADDPRVGTFVSDDVASVATGWAVLIGFPSDEGVRINGGRIGSADGPDAIRAHLYPLTPDARSIERHTSMLRRVVDLGNIAVSGDLERDQESLAATVAWALERGAVPIILGGGHESAYGHYLGHVLSGHAATIVNWDAHLDVRPLKDGRAHSGSPFRQALTHTDHPCRRYVAVGVQAASAARPHLEFVAAHAGRIWFADEITLATVDAVYRTVAAPTMVTFDLDAVESSAAPGVSAPAPAGLPVEVWLKAARVAGRLPYVQSFDVSELNPRFDVDGRTARLAARTVWEFVRGLAERA